MKTYTYSIDCFVCYLQYHFFFQSHVTFLLLNASRIYTNDVRFEITFFEAIRWASAFDAQLQVALVERRIKNV